MAEKDTIENRLTLLSQSNGSVDWHLSTSYEDEDISQALSVRPQYDYSDRPLDGDVTVHALRNDGETFGEAELSVPVTEFARLCRQFLAMLDADQRAYDHAFPNGGEEEGEDDADDDDDEEEEEEEDDDDGSPEEDSEDE